MMGSRVSLRRIPHDTGRKLFGREDGGSHSDTSPMSPFLPAVIPVALFAFSPPKCVGERLHLLQGHSTGLLPPRYHRFLSNEARSRAASLFCA